MKIGTSIFSPLVAGLALATLLNPNPTFAQEGNVKEGVRNAVEAGRDRRNLKDDRRDRAAIASIAHDWRKARRTSDKSLEKQADARLKAWIIAELRESSKDAAHARQETRGSRRERDRSSREAAGSGGLKDRHDVRDDRRDLRDDRRDSVAAHADLAQTRAVARQLRDMQPAFDSGTATKVQYKKKAGLIQKLVRMAKREVRQDKREVREDRRERREDRRERREDRRNRRGGK